MKIAVVIKQVPDTETKISIGQDGRSIDESNVNWIVNPYDEFAMEEALKTRESKGEGEVTVLTVGPERATAALRTCLAMGADKAIHLDDSALAQADSLGTAALLAAAIKEIGADLIFAGQYAVGTDHRQTGMMLAELLDMPHVGVVIGLEVGDGKLTAHREIEGAHEIVEASLPCVVTAQKGLNEPRYASLKGIMQAKKKPIDKKDAAALGVDAGSLSPYISVSKLELPPPKQEGKIFSDDLETSVKEVTRLLHEEAKVI